MTKLAVATITKNEEHHIARALQSARGIADELIVIDAESTDRTVEIARRFTDKIFVRPWPGYGPQKNFALEQATSDWVFFVDADEEVTPELAREIEEFIRRHEAAQLGRHPEQREGSPSKQPRSFGFQPQDDTREINVVFVKIVTEFLGRPLTHLWGTNPRLLRRGAARWQNRAVHEQVVRPDGSIVRLGDPDTILLKEALAHPSHYQRLAAYLKKRERYTLRDAEEMLETGRDRLGKPVHVVLHSPFSVLHFLFARALKQFIRLFFKKRGFLDGWRGWLWCFLSAQYEYVMCRKYLMLLRRQQAPHFVPPIDGTSRGKTGSRQ